MSAAPHPRVKVALVWPGGVFGAEGNFGVPQLLSLASALMKQGLADVTVYDFDAELAQGGFSPSDFQRESFDIVAISCYSSYDYLKVMSIAAGLKRLTPDAWFVVGGYHPSARPDDFASANSPFQYVVVGEGERALVELVGCRANANEPSARIIVGQAIDPRATLPYPFELIERYRDSFERFGQRFELYLSRGCPYGCSFCMERSKRNVQWRALEVGEAIEQIDRLERFVDLTGKVLRISDALFAMRRSWRREFLEGLARRPVRADKIWLLTRADLLEEEDFRLMAAANLAPGFGLESGDPGILLSTGKLRSSPERFYEHLFHIAEWSRRYRVPFGTNVIVGLPGETRDSLERTVNLLDRLFFGPSPTYGFFGIDRFRLYPGSAISADLVQWEMKTGCVVHRPKWWLDGDQDFLSEWIDPSRDMDFDSAMQVCFPMFAPRLAELEQRFAYDGPARDRFLGTISENRLSWSEQARQRQMELAQIWAPLRGVECAEFDPPALFAG